MMGGEKGILEYWNIGSMEYAIFIGFYYSNT
jgi:hypothetical protein